MALKRFEPPSRTLIEGVKVKHLKVIADERGRLMELLRADDELYRQFGQVYMTSAYPGVVKAWHYHKAQWDNFACIHGMMKLALYDDRPGSPTRGLVNEFVLGEHNPLLVRIPPLVYHGFKGVGEKEAIVVNIPTEVYSYQEPDEFRCDPHENDIPYEWARKDG